MASGSIALLSLPVSATSVVAPFRAVTGFGAYPLAGAGVRGVVRTSAAVGDLMTADVLGTTLIEAGGICTQGALLMVDDQGRAVDKSGLTVGFGYAQTGAAAAGALVEVLIARPTA